jgi:uncharacterized protein (TIGR02300 family)
MSKKGAARKTGTGKKASKKPASRPAKEAAKKPAKKAAPKKAAPKKPAKPAARPPRQAAEAAPRPETPKAGAKPAPAPAAAPAPAPKAKAKAKPSKARSGRERQAARRQEPQPVGERKPGLGAKWNCFRCGAKFYDLNRPDPVCPKCGANQRERPFESSTSESSGPAQRRPALAPMSRFLDEEEPVATEYEEEEAAEIDLDALEEGGYLDTLEEEDE